MTITDLKPSIVWKYFHQVTQVPRPSKKEEKIIAYLESFAKEHGIDYIKDEAGNLLMNKPATLGYENRQKVIFQSHVDMVCEKNKGTEHDFDNDPIRTIVEGDWLRADGTTLGADNGIGVAAQLALLASDDIEHGPLELLFTVDEETGLTGAKAVQPGFLTGNILINLDSEDEGEIFMGCAGGKDTQAVFTYVPQPTDASKFYASIEVKGLSGGHSGGEIHKGLGNANKVLARFLYLLDKQYPWTLCSFNGGNLRNAIAREATAVIGIDPKDKEDVRIFLNHFAANISRELHYVDPKVEIVMQTADRPEVALCDVCKMNLVRALVAVPHGVIGMSHAIEGLVETSTNLASVKMQAGNTILVGTSQRSSIESAKEAIVNQVAATFLLAGATVSHGDGYPGWEPNPDSAILHVAKDAYCKLFNKEPKVMAIHAGLECGLFLEKYPQLDMISFGPTMRDVHSPSERLLIPTVQLWWDHLLELLKNVPSK